MKKQQKVRDAVEDGRLSPEQTEKISDAVDADPCAEERLLKLAEHSSLKELGEECDRVTAAADPDPDATHRRIHKDRCVRFWTMAGVASMLARCTPEQMASIKAAVEHRAEQLFQTARHRGTYEPREAYLMDALEQICQQWMGETAAPADSDGQDSPMTLPFDSPPSQPAEERPAPIKPRPAPNRKPPPYLGLIRVDHSALMRGRVEGEELCEIAGLGPIPVSVARRLLTDAVLHLILTKGSAVATTVILKRGATVAQRMALLWAHPLCCITGCNNPRREIDHAEPWVETHHTVLDELQPMCGPHHKLKTHHGYQVVEVDGVKTMVPPGAEGRAPPAA